MLTAEFVLGIYDRDRTPHSLIIDEEELTTDLSNIWETIYSSFDGYLGHEFDAGITITCGEHKFETGSYLQHLMYWLCINAPMKLLKNEIAVLPATDSSDPIFFERKSDEVFVRSEPPSRSFEVVFPFSELVVELFHCGKRMLRFYDEFWQLAGVESHPALGAYQQPLLELHQLLKEHGLID